MKKNNNFSVLEQAVDIRCKITNIEFEIKSKFNPTIVETVKKEEALMFDIDIT